MLRTLGGLWFHLNGWTFKNEVPDDLRSFVFLGAPHTSNMDLFAAMAVANLMKRNAKFVIKHDWLKFPMNLLMRPAGAVGLNREELKLRGAANTTELMADLFKQYEELVLMISPEGTRSPNAHWKTGFYYIAQKAQVPIVLGYADYKNKILGLGPVIYPTDFARDFKRILDFYKNIQGRWPDKFLLDSRYQELDQTGL